MMGEASETRIIEAIRRAAEQLRKPPLPLTLEQRTENRLKGV